MLCVVTALWTMCYGHKEEILFNMKSNKIPIKWKKEGCVPRSQYL